MSHITIDQAMQLAIQQHQAGHLPEAEAIYRQIVAQLPAYAPAWHLLGVLASQKGRPDSAAELIQRAIALDPLAPVPYSNLANLLTGLGQAQAAVAAARRAIELQPNFVEAHNHLGNALVTAGQPDAALLAYQRTIDLRRDFPEAHNNLGNLLRELGQLPQSVASCREAIRLRPDYAEAHRNLGNTLHLMGHLEEAIACYRNALACRPAYPEAHNNLGTALHAQGRLDAAIDSFQNALHLNPGFAEVFNNLGMVQKDAGGMKEAIHSFRRALALRPNFSEAHSNLIYALKFCEMPDTRSLHAELTHWQRQHASPLQAHIQPWTNRPVADRKLRIGYLSGDFRDHVVGRNLIPLFREHDRRQVEIFCYSNVIAPDTFTEQFRGYANHWRSLVGLSDEQAAALIRQDQIDILVDLSLHMAGNRLLVLARKPAPIQVTFAGYPGSTGLETVDYRLTDHYLDPPEGPELHYSEESVRLPHSFWCYDPIGEEPAINALPAQTHGFITFGCFNNFCKVNEGVLQLWAEVLLQVKNSRLMMLAAEGSHRQRTLKTLEQAGVSKERVTFVTMRPHAEYLKLYHQVDMALETFPYNGHTTSLDALWMGVPVVTLVGKTVVGRAGLCQLMNLKMPELIAHTKEAYTKITVALANDLPRLSHLRQTLRQRMRASPLMEAQGFARDIETAYRAMWRTWCASSEDAHVTDSTRADPVA